MPQISLIIALLCLAACSREFVDTPVYSGTSSEENSGSADGQDGATSDSRGAADGGDDDGHADEQEDDYDYYADGGEPPAQDLDEVEADAGEPDDPNNPDDDPAQRNKETCRIYHGSFNGDGDPEPHFVVTVPAADIPEPNYNDDSQQEDCRAALSNIMRHGTAVYYQGMNRYFSDDEDMPPRDSTLRDASTFSYAGETYQIRTAGEPGSIECEAVPRNLLGRCSWNAP